LSAAHARQTETVDGRAVRRDRNQKAGFLCLQPRLKGSRTVGEFRDRGFTKQASRRLLDRAVTVEKQPVVATDDDTQVDRQRHCITQGAVRAD
jgi:hypothetical protein